MIIVDEQELRNLNLEYGNIIEIRSSSKWGSTKILGYFDKFAHNWERKQSVHLHDESVEGGRYQVPLDEIDEIIKYSISATLR